MSSKKLDMAIDSTQNTLPIRMLAMPLGLPCMMWCILEPAYQIIVSHVNVEVARVRTFHTSR